MISSVCYQYHSQTFEPKKNPTTFPVFMWIWSERFIVQIIQYIISVFVSSSPNEKQKTIQSSERMLSSVSSYMCSTNTHWSSNGLISQNMHPNNVFFAFFSFFVIRVTEKKRFTLSAGILNLLAVHPILYIKSIGRSPDFIFRRGVADKFTRTTANVMCTHFHVTISVYLVPYPSVQNWINYLLHSPKDIVKGSQIRMTQIRMYDSIGPVPNRITALNHILCFYYRCPIERLRTIDRKSGKNYDKLKLRCVKYIMCARLSWSKKNGSR